MDVNQILEIKPYSLNKVEKSNLLNECLINLTNYHYKNCDLYKNMLDALNIDLNNLKLYEDIPFLPVRLFKDNELKSIKNEEVVKTMTSSGTTGSKVSKIYLDKETSSNQTKILTKIMSSYIGTKRLPMIIIDSSDVIKNRNMFSARGAGILGFSIFGRDKIYALDENMNIDLEGLSVFLEKHKGEEILLFGFTFMIWQHFYKELKKVSKKLDLSKGILIHGGGWKKLISESVDNEKFKEELKGLCNIQKVYNYYGMVEQTGSIYMECECGHLHSSIFSDVIIRNHIDFKPTKVGEEGIIEVVSLLPKSYPGHAILTEDLGVLLGEDDCPCGRLGKYFKINGRIKDAEIRGCSDTYASDFR